MLKRQIVLIFVLHSLIQYYWKSVIQENFEELDFKILMDSIYSTFVQPGDSSQI